MKHKKLKFSVLLMFVSGLTGLHAQTLYVKQTSNTQTAYTLSAIKKMSFSSGNITLSKTIGSSDTYPLSGIRYLNFQDLSTSIVGNDKKNIALLLYPNPVLDVLNIQLSDKQGKTCVIEVLSVDGRVVYQEKVYTQGDVYQLSVSALTKGLYLCRIHKGSATETARFIKH